MSIYIPNFTNTRPNGFITVVSRPVESTRVLDPVTDIFMRPEINGISYLKSGVTRFDVSLTSFVTSASYNGTTGNLQLVYAAAPGTGNAPTANVQIPISVVSIGAANATTLAWEYANGTSGSFSVPTAEGAFTLNLNDTLESTSTTEGATANMANALNNAINTSVAGRLSLSGGTLTGPLTVSTPAGNVGLSGDGGGLSNLMSGNLVGLVNPDLLPTASLSLRGIVQLNNTLTSPSTAQAATANAVYTLNNLLSGYLPLTGGNLTGAITVTTAAGFKGFTGDGGGLSNIRAANIVGTLTVPTGNLTDAGIVQLNDTVTSVSTTQAATANTANALNSAIINRLPLSGGTLTGGLTVTTAAGVRGFIGDGGGLSNIPAANIVGAVVASVPAANLTAAGIVQLNDTLISVSTSQAATANTANALNAAITNRLPLSGGTLTGGLTVTTAAGVRGFIGDGGGLSNIPASNIVGSVVAAANLTAAGIVQLNDTLTSVSTSQAATANTANALNAAIINRLPITGGTLSGALTVTTAVGVSGFNGDGRGLSNIAAGNITTGTVSTAVLPTGTTTGPGILQLQDTLNSTLTSRAATANMVNALNTAVNDRLPFSGGTITGSLTVNGVISGNGSGLTNLTLPTGSTTVTGILRLDDTLAGLNITNRAATANMANALNTAVTNLNTTVNNVNTAVNNRLQLSGGTITGSLTVNGTISGSGSGLTNLAAGSIATGVIAVDRLPAASTLAGGEGIVRLVDSVTSTRTDRAAAANAVNTLYNLALIGSSASVASLDSGIVTTNRLFFPMNYTDLGAIWQTSVNLFYGSGGTSAIKSAVFHHRIIKTADVVQAGISIVAQSGGFSASAGTPGSLQQDDIIVFTRNNTGAGYFELCIILGTNYLSTTASANAKTVRLI